MNFVSVSNNLILSISKIKTHDILSNVHLPERWTTSKLKNLQNYYYQT